MEPGRRSRRQPAGYTYTDRPVYRPGDIVHFKTIVRAQTTSGYVIPQDRELRLELRDPQSYQTIWQQTVKLSDMGTADWDYAIPADANLGFYYLSMQMGERYVEGTSFSVEDYKKPEYQVKVTAQTPRVLQGPADQGDDRRALLLWRAGRQRQGEVGGAHLELLAVGTRRRRRRSRRRSGGR